MINKKNFLFCVFITVSDNPSFLKLSVSSILDQTLDFKENIQIIFIDYGGNSESTDFVKKICAKYPENIVYLTKDYLCQPYAENNVYKLPNSEYVTFLEGNDFFSKNTFKEVKNFYDKHSDETNILSIPLFNGNIESELNYKFEQTRVINLDEDANYPQLHLKSCFIKKSALYNYKYNRKTLFEEETILINRLLLDHPRIGVIDNAEYHIRQTFDINQYKGHTTNNQKHLQKINIIKTLIKNSITKKGIVPDFIKYTIAYYIQDILKISDLSFLNKEEKDYLLDELRNIISVLDDDLVYGNDNIDDALRGFFIYLKKGVYSIVNVDDNVVMHSGDYYIDDLKKHRVWLDFVDIKDGHLVISGVYTTNFDNDSLSINLVKENDDDNREVLPCSYVFYPQRDRSNVSYLGIPWKFVYNFEVSLELKDVIHDKYSFEVVFEEGDLDFAYVPKIEFRVSSFFSNVSIYAVIGDYILFKDSSSISVIPYSFGKLFNFEVKNILRIIKSSEKGKMGAALLHFLYLLLYRFMAKKRIWLLNDRLDLVDDNAKHLFEYASKQEDGISKYLVVDKNSRDYKELKRKYKNIISYGSLKHKILYLFCEKRISSFLNENFYNPFYNDEEDKRKLYCNLVTAPRYFLQHGVISCDLTEQIRRYDHNLALILTSSDLECQSFFDLNYNFPRQTIQVLGLPRYDKLTNNEKKKQILFIPSWRLYFDKDEELLKQSDYYKSIESLINNKKLAKLLDITGYHLIFKPHPEIVKYAEKFKINSNVKLSLNDSFQELFNNSSLLITDFSSVIFDFSYLKKPVIYYQPNNDYHYKEGYFNYENMGFGDVIRNEEELILKIKEYIENDCIMEKKYQERVTSFFKYNDKNNSKRVIEWIKKN